jgi:hypothetical protein
LSGSPMPQAYLCSDKMMGFSRLSRFGMTFKPLTADRGEAVLMSYLEAFRAKTSPQQEREPESKVSDQACGERWHGWLAKFDPDTSTLRTAQCSLLEGEPELLQTLPRSGITLSGTLWERQTLVRRISETESGLWQKTFPTPTVSDAMGAGRNGPRKDRKDGNVSSLKDFLSKQYRLAYPPVSIAEYMMGWPLGWTDLKPLEMDKFQEWQQQHGEFLGDQHADRKSA